jgi:uridine kinase
MPRHVSQAVARDVIAAAAAARPGETTWIGIDGGTGAGKSRFATRLAGDLPNAVVIAVDDFAGPGIDEWDWTRFRSQVLEPLQAGRPARYDRWDWQRDSSSGSQVVTPRGPVIVEGVSATRREAGVPWTIRVWVDAGRALRIERVRTRGTPTQLIATWLASEDAYVEREHPERDADLIVVGAEPDW